METENSPRIYVKLAFYLFIVCLQFIFAISSLAFQSNPVVLILGQDRIIKFSGILAEYDELLRQTQKQRNKFEDINTYEARREKARKRFSKFIDSRYLAEIEPDEISLDWENSCINIKISSSIDVLRTRGYANRTIDKIIPVEPNLAREIMTFSDKLKIIIKFRINRQKAIIIDKFNVSYRQKLISHE